MVTSGIKGDGMEGVGHCFRQSSEGRPWRLGRNSRWREPQIEHAGQKRRPVQRPWGQERAWLVRGQHGPSAVGDGDVV